MHRTAWRLAAAAVALALVPALSACSVGVDAGTSVQGPSGNGSNANVGPMQLRAITIVTAADQSTRATVIGTIVNTGTDDDTLTGVTIVSPSGATATVTGSAATGGQLPLPAQSATRIGFNADDHVDISNLTIAPSAYAEVQFTFAKAGIVTVPAMAVPPRGIYTGLGPLTG